MVPEVVSKDHSTDHIAESNHFDTVVGPKRLHGYGEKTFAYFGAVFF